MSFETNNNNNNLIATEHMTKSETIKLRNKHIGKSCHLFYRSDPLKIVKGQGQYMFDEHGVKYLDCINNVAHVGHCHPKVVAAGSKQMSLLSTNNRFLHDELVKCAQTLTKKMPGELSVCFFVNSGSEANDLALRLAMKYTAQTEVITLDHAYHGHLKSVMDISPYKFNNPGGDTKPNYVHVAACPDTYRGKYKKSEYRNDEDLGKLYANDIDGIIKKIQDNGKGIACFIAETLQSCGGQIIPPSNYFENVYKLIHDANGIVIADEVQVGFGRIGKHYWAFQKYNVVPDIVTVAKPMGNGYPVGAVITTPAIADCFASSGICYFNTYGGNPVSCAIANAVMDVIETEHLQENALLVGNYLIEKFLNLKTEFNIIGDVRGIGLFLGIELIKIEMVPATQEATWIVDRMKNTHHTLLSADGPDNNVLKLKPPMIFNLENADQFIVSLRECFNALLIRDIKTTTNIPVTTNGTCISPVKPLHEQHNILIKSI